MPEGNRTILREKNVNNSNNAEGKIATKTNVESDALTVIFFNKIKIV